MREYKELGNPQDLNRLRRAVEQVSVAGWENSTQDPLYGAISTSRGVAEDVITVVAGPEPCGQSVGPRYCEGADRRIVGATARFVVEDRRPSGSPGIRQGRQVLDRQAQ